MTRRGWRTTFALTAGLALLAVASVAPAQEKQPPSAAFLQGTEAFRRVVFDTGQQFFGKTGFQPLGSFGELTDPQHTILIVLGDADRLREVPGGLQSFVQRGGALFLATDRHLHGAADSALVETAGVRVSGKTIVCDDPEACYHRLQFCPFVQGQDGADPDLLRDLTSRNSTASVVATNAPSYLEVVGDPSLKSLAWLPEGSHLEAAPFFVGDGAFLFAVGGNVDAGRALVVADHSIFINDMMMRNDNANVEFSYNCLKWLSNVGGGEPRTKVLFVEEGNVNAKFEVPLKEMPDELMDRMLDFILNHLSQVAQKAVPALEKDIQAFDQRNGFDRKAMDYLRNIGASENVLPRLLLVVLAILLVKYGCWKIGFKARHRTDLQGPLLATALHRLAPVGSLAEQRRQALVRGDNLWEPAHDLARQCFAAADAPAGKSPPRMAVQGGWLRWWIMTARVKRLWRLAYGPPVRVPPREWPKLVGAAREVKAALADGTVQFQ